MASKAVTNPNLPDSNIYLQRAVLINSILAIPISLIWLFESQKILFYFGVPESLAVNSQNYIRCLVPSLFANATTICFSKYLQAERNPDPPFYISCFVMPFSIILQWFLVYKTNLGYVGAAVGTSIADTAVAILITTYTLCKNNFTWSNLCFREWLEFFKLGLPSMFMYCSELWVFEVVSIFASQLGSVTLAAQSIIITTCGVLFMVYSGISIAGANIIGNLLGSNEHLKAKKTFHCLLMVSLFSSFIFSILLLLLRKKWSFLFLNDENVAKVVSETLPICACFQYADSLATILGGVIRGCGKQKYFGFFNIFSYNLLGIPLIYYLSTKFEFSGMLWGLAVVLFLTAFSQLFYLLFLKWETFDSLNTPLLLDFE